MKRMTNFSPRAGSNLSSSELNYLKQVVSIAFICVHEVVFILVTREAKEGSVIKIKYH